MFTTWHLLDRMPQRTSAVCCLFFFLVFLFLKFYSLGKKTSFRPRVFSFPQPDIPKNPRISNFLSNCSSSPKPKVPNPHLLPSSGSCCPSATFIKSLHTNQKELQR